MIELVRGPDIVLSSDPSTRQRCDTCGCFIAFAALRHSELHYTPLNEFGPEEVSWTGPCCGASIDREQQPPQ